MDNSDEQYMEQALAVAAEGLAKGELPIGAIELVNRWSPSAAAFFRIARLNCLNFMSRTNRTVR